MDNIEDCPSPPFWHHRPGLASRGVAQDGIALASEWDVLQLEARQGGAVCLYFGICRLAGSDCFKIDPLLDGFNSYPGECIRNLIVFSLHMPNIGGEFRNVS